MGKTVKGDEKLRENKRSRRMDSLRGNEVKNLARNLLKYPLAPEARVVAVATREPVGKPVENAPSSCQLINSYCLVSLSQNHQI